MSFSLKPASIASAVCHPYQIIVLYMLTTLLSQGFKLLYEGKNTACMVTTRGPTPTGIQHKSFRIPNGIWNVDEESEILNEMKS